MELPRKLLDIPKNNLDLPLLFDVSGCLKFVKRWI
jgi:hypothetical protein